MMFILDLTQNENSLSLRNLSNTKKIYKNKITVQVREAAEGEIFRKGGGGGEAMHCHRRHADEVGDGHK